MAGLGMNSRWSRASRRPVDHHVFSLGAAPRRAGRRGRL